MRPDSHKAAIPSHALTTPSARPEFLRTEFEAVDCEGEGTLNEPSDSETSRRELACVRQELFQAQQQIGEMAREIVALGETIQRLNTLAWTDVLTGLSNRRRFTEALETSYELFWTRGASLSLIMLDIDHFKAYNDEFGHSAGDGVLCVFASQMLACCRAYDIVARYGGEEFAVLLPTADLDEAARIAERQRQAIESYPWPLRKVTASFGVATMTPATRSPSELVERADRALYASKRQGRNRVSRQFHETPCAASASPRNRLDSASHAPDEAETTTFSEHSGGLPLC